MRKRILLLQFVLLAVWAAAAPHNFYRDEERNLRRTTFLAQAMNGEVQVKMGYYYNDDEHPKEAATYEEIARRAITAWFAVPEKTIRENNRTDEFKEEYKVFADGIKVAFVSDEPDITISILELDELLELCDGSTGCYNPENREIKVGEITEKHPKEKLLRTLTHEVGHAFGLTDQYKEALYDNMTISHEYGSPEESRDSIMNTADEIGLDDVDGMINALDLEWLSRGKTLGRGPWRGFSGKYTYENGKYVGKGKARTADPYFVFKDGKLDDGTPYWDIHSDSPDISGTYTLTNWAVPVDMWKVMKEPLKMQEEITPFSITHGVGPNKEEVTCYDLFLQTRCFGKINGLLVWAQFFQREEHKDNDRERWIRRQLYFKHQGFLVRMTWMYQSNLFLNYFSVSETAFASDKEDFTAILSFGQSAEDEPSFSRRKETVSAFLTPQSLAEGYAEQLQRKMTEAARDPSKEIILPFMRK